MSWGPSLAGGGITLSAHTATHMGWPRWAERAVASFEGQGHPRSSILVAHDTQV